MANEATIKNRFVVPYDVDVLDNTAFEKGTVLQASGPRGGFPSAGLDTFAGISQREKIKDDGRTRMAVIDEAIAEMYAGGGTTISVNELVRLSGPNTVEGDVTEAMIIAGKTIGRAMSGVTVGTAARIQVRVGAY